MSKDINIEINNDGDIEIKGVEPGKEANKGSIGKVLGKLHSMLDTKLVEEDKKREKLYSTENFAKLFKIMQRGNSPVSSDIGDAWTYFYARKPKTCKRCLMLFGAHCHWGFRTSIQGIKISPKDKKGACMPFKIRGYKLTNEQIKKHKENISAHVNDLLDSFEELFDKGIT